MMIKDIIDGMEDLSKIERINLIFRWHNAMIVEMHLSEFTLGMRDLKFVPGDMTGDLVFKDDIAEVVFNEGGLIDQDRSDFYYKELEDLVVARFARTKRMVETMNKGGLVK